MKFFGPLSRTLALAGLFSVALFSAPAMAAKADVELLQSYIGQWKGRGQLVGAVPLPYSSTYFWNCAPLAFPETVSCAVCTTRAVWISASSGVGSALSLAVSTRP